MRTYMKNNPDDGFYHIRANSLMMKLCKMDEAESITAAQLCPVSSWMDAAEYLDRVVDVVEHDQWHARLAELREQSEYARQISDLRQF
jgi:hypothetical protein